MSAMPGASWSVNTTSSSARRSRILERSDRRLVRGGQALRPGLEHDDPAALSLHLHASATERRRSRRPRRGETRRRAARGRPPRLPRRDGTCASPVRPAAAPRRRPRRRRRRTPRSPRSRGPRRPARSTSSSRRAHGGEPITPHGLGLDPRGSAAQPRRHDAVGSSRWPVGWAPVDPPRSSTACGTTGSTAASDSRTPFGLPGRFTISVAADAPATARDSAAIGVCGEPGGAHQLREPRGVPVDHGAGRLRRHVSRPEPGAAGRHDQRVRAGELPERRLDLRTLVGDDPAIGDLEPGLAEHLHRGVAGSVLTGALRRRRRRRSARRLGSVPSRRRA